VVTATDRPEKNAEAATSSVLATAAGAMHQNAMGRVADRGSVNRTVVAVRIVIVAAYGSAGFLNH